MFVAIEIIDVWTYLQAPHLESWIAAGGSPAAVIAWKGVGIVAVILIARRIRSSRRASVLALAIAIAAFSVGANASALASPRTIIIPVYPERLTPEPLTPAGGRNAVLTASRTPTATEPVGRIARPSMGGRVSYADPSYGPRYLAMRLPRGTIVGICGPGGCVTRRVTDYGPSRKIRPPRLADLSWWDWLHVCGERTHSAGICKASAVILDRMPQLPATDTD